MNKAELKAMTLIAKKLDWQHKPAVEVLYAILEMVGNKQNLELEIFGECDDFEETLLSMPSWDVDKLISCLYCWDFPTHTAYWDIITSMHISGLDFHAWVQAYNQVHVAFAEEYEYEEMLSMEEALQEEHYYEVMRDVAWITKHC